eukprot:scaffold92490_cov16-Prasinocladus_malaysianus.AAC.1
MPKIKSGSVWLRREALTRTSNTTALFSLLVEFLIAELQEQPPQTGIKLYTSYSGSHRNGANIHQANNTFFILALYRSFELILGISGDSYIYSVALFLKRLMLGMRRSAKLTHASPFSFRYGDDMGIGACPHLGKMGTDRPCASAWRLMPSN